MATLIGKMREGGDSSIGLWGSQFSGEHRCLFPGASFIYDLPKQVKTAPKISRISFSASRVGSDHVMPRKKWLTRQPFTDIKDHPSLDCSEFSQQKNESRAQPWPAQATLLAVGSPCWAWKVGLPGDAPDHPIQ
jgi:hypothetical protein